MPTWQKKHYQAIEHYAKSNGLKMMMSRFPKAQFLDKNGVTVTKDINDLLVNFSTSQKEENQERKRLKNEEENRKPWTERFKRR